MRRAERLPSRPKLCDARKDFLALSEPPPRSKRPIAAIDWLDYFVVDVVSQPSILTNARVWPLSFLDVPIIAVKEDKYITVSL